MNKNSDKIFDSLVLVNDNMTGLVVWFIESMSVI